jgi:hypothetical protein
MNQFDISASKYSTETHAHIKRKKGLYFLMRGGKNNALSRREKERAKTAGSELETAERPGNDGRW